MKEQETIANYFICIKPTSGSVALVKDEQGYQLPVIHLERPLWPPQFCPNFNGELMDRFGLNCTVLQWLRGQEDHNLLLMEWHPGAKSPEIDVEWIDPSRQVVRLPKRQMQMLNVWLESSSQELVPWERPGWMEEVVLTLFKVFKGGSYPQMTNLAQTKAGWGMSTLLLIETTQDDYFFKAGVTQGIAEWKVTRALYKQFPQYVVNPVLVHEQQDWMITKRIEHEPIAALDEASLSRVYHAYAEIQMGCADIFNKDTEGLRIRDAAWMKDHLIRLFSDDLCPREFLEPKSTLNAGQSEWLKNKWMAQIEALGESIIPLGFGQEDLHLENVLNTPDGPVFIDWADCALSHPFMSIHRTLRLWDAGNEENTRLEVQIVKQAYLNYFSKFASTDRLHEEFELTRQLSILYGAFRCLEIAAGQRADTAWRKQCIERASRCMREAIIDRLPESQADIHV